MRKEFIQPSLLTGMMQKEKLTIDDRSGTFPGMLESRKFNIVVVDIIKHWRKRDCHTDKAINYSGKNSCKILINEQEKYRCKNYFILLLLNYAQLQLLRKS